MCIISHHAEPLAEYIMQIGHFRDSVCPVQLVTTGIGITTLNTLVIDLMKLLEQDSELNFSEI